MQDQDPNTPPPSTAHARPRRLRGRHERPAPLLRTALTICAPWDPWPVTLQVIVLSATPAADDVTAAVEDVPELQEAGWEDSVFGPLHVWTRVIA